MENDEQNEINLDSPFMQLKVVLHSNKAEGLVVLDINKIVSIEAAALGSCIKYKESCYLVVESVAEVIASIDARIEAARQKAIKDMEEAEEKDTRMRDAVENRVKIAEDAAYKKGYAAAQEDCTGK